MFKALLIGGSPPLLRSHVLAALDSLRPPCACTVVSSVRGGRELAAVASPPFDLIVVDLSVADADAAVLLVDLHSASSARPIVAMPAVDRRSDVLGALQLGAAGVLPRDASAEDSLLALRTVLAGDVYMPARLMRGTAPVAGGTSARSGQFLASGPQGHATPADLSRLALTARQTEVLARLLHGHSNKEIARELNLSVETIKDHVAAVLRALSVHSRTQAVLAVERLLREPEQAPRAVPSLQSTWQAVVGAPVTSESPSARR